MVKESMFGIKIRDSKSSAGGGGMLSFDLRDILEVIGEPALASEWRCLNLWYTAVRDGEFGEFRERRRRLSGKELVEFSASVHQSIDGKFIAKKNGTNKPWLIILAVDSSWFEVWCSKQEVIEKLKDRFAKVHPLSSDGAEPTLAADSR